MHASMNVVVCYGEQKALFNVFVSGSSGGGGAAAARAREVARIWRQTEAGTHVLLGNAYGTVTAG
jgi:hypothetical protein